MSIGNPNNSQAKKLIAFLNKHGDDVTRRLSDEVWGEPGMWSPENKFTNWPTAKREKMMQALDHYEHMTAPGTKTQKSRVLVSIGGEPGSGKTLLREFLMTVLESSGFVTSETNTASDDDFKVMLDAEGRARLAVLASREDGTSAETEYAKHDGSKIAMQQRAVEKCRAAHKAFIEALEQAQAVDVMIPMAEVATLPDGSQALVNHDYKAPLSYNVAL